MKKAIIMKIHGLKCDAPGCGYTQAEPIGNTYESYAAWLNKPCPRCGSNLLTEADLNTARTLLGIARFINALLWPLSKVLPATNKPIVFDLGMDGSGKINPKRVDE